MRGERRRERREGRPPGAVARAAAIVALALLPASVRAAPDAQASAEIAALLDYVGRSACTFVRSGEAHDGAKARQHLERKYTYARPLLSSADQFVDRVASASSITGEPYHVVCDGRELGAREWLHAELQRLRTQRARGGGQ